MFPSQMVHLKIVSPSNGPPYPYFPCKWYTLKSLLPQIPTLSMFQSEMVHLKIVSPSNGKLYPCFTRKWYALKLFLPQMTNFINVSFANGTP